MCSSTLSIVTTVCWQYGHIGLCTGSSKPVNEDIFMWPINSSWLLKMMRQCMQVPNPSDDVNSKVPLNFVICFKGLLAVKIYQLQHSRFWVCFSIDFHVFNNLLLVDEVGMAERAMIFRSFRGRVHAIRVWLTIHASSSSSLSHPSTSGRILWTAFITSVELFSLTSLTRAQKRSTDVLRKVVRATLGHNPLEVIPETLN